jgi:hypothetical protein
MDKSCLYIHVPSICPSLHLSVTFVFKTTALEGFESTLLYQPHLNIALTPWSWVLLDKPPVAQLVECFPIFYGTRRFTIMFTKSRHWSLSWARLIQSISLHPISLESILILSSHLRLSLPSVVLPLVSPPKLCMYSSYPHACYIPCPSHPDLIILIMFFAKRTNYKVLHFAVFSKLL